VANRLQRGLERRGRIGVERILLALHRAAGAGEGPPGEALGEEAPGAGGASGREQVVRTLGAQPVGGGESAVEMAGVERSGQRRELMHDRLWLGLADDSADRLGIERVGDRRLRAELCDQLAFGLAAGDADDLMAVGGELRQQLPAERPGGPGDQDLHRNSFRRLINPETRWRPAQ
jgi:hypothetical protein